MPKFKNAKLSGFWPGSINLPKVCGGGGGRGPLGGGGPGGGGGHPFQLSHILGVLTPLVRVALLTRGGARRAFQLIPAFVSSLAKMLSPASEIQPRQPTGANSVFKLEVVSVTLAVRLTRLVGSERVPASAGLRAIAVSLFHVWPGTSLRILTVVVQGRTATRNRSGICDRVKQRIDETFGRTAQLSEARG